jgi:fumarate reductase flavoprotein subunit
MPEPIEQLTTDILILGSGGAGLFAALHAKQAAPDLEIMVAVKGLLGKCGCTRMVQGGYNVALAPTDSVERHFMDTIEGGKWLNNQALAWRLVTTATRTAPSTRRPLPGRASTGRCTRAA